MAGRDISTKQQGGGSNGYLLSAAQSDTTSTPFAVKGHAKRIVAFGLMGNDRININRVLLPQGESKRSACGEYISGGIVAEQPHKIGTHEIYLDAAQPEVVIDATGDYRIVFEGENREEVNVVLETATANNINNTMRGIR